jgi:hypothetical protein
MVQATHLVGRGREKLVEGAHVGGRPVENEMVTIHIFLVESLATFCPVQRLLPQVVMA